MLTPHTFLPPPFLFRSEVELGARRSIVRRTSRNSVRRDAPPCFYARLELGAFAIPCKSRAEWLDFLTLSLADWLEQVEGAARAENPPVLWGKGEAWAYRRDGYAAMAALPGIAEYLSARPQLGARKQGNPGSLMYDGQSASSGSYCVSS